MSKEVLGRRRSSVREFVRRASNISLSSLKDRILGRSRSNSRQQSFSWSDGDNLRELLRPILAKLADDGEIDARDANFALKDSQFLLRVLNEFSDLSDTSDDVTPFVNPVIDCLKNRKSVGVANITRSNFPADLFDADLFCAYKQLAEPRTVFLRVSAFRKVAQFEQIYVHILVANIETNLENLYDGKYLNLVVDVTGISMSQIEQVVSILNTLYQLYPGYVDKVYVVNLPFYYRAGLFVLLKVFPERQRAHIVTISKNDLIEKLGIETCPSFVNGKGDDSMEWSSDMKPNKCATYEELADRYKASTSNVKKLREAFESAKKMTC